MTDPTASPHDMAAPFPGWTVPLLPAMLLTLLLVYPVFTGSTATFDQAAHRDFAQALRDEGQLLTPHFVYHLLLLGVDALIPGGGLRIAGLTVNIAAYALAGTLYFAWAVRQLYAVTSTRRALGWGLVLLPLLAFAGPPLAARPYETGAELLNTIIYNPWNNPTQSTLLPLSLLLYGLTLRLLFGAGLSRAGLIALGILALVTPLAKPNFSMVLLPAVVLIVGVRLIQRRDVPLRALTLAFILPTLVALGWQFVFTYVQQNTLGFGFVETNSILLAPFRTALAYDDQLATALLKLGTSLLFPAWALLAYPALRRDPIPPFTALLVGIGLAQYLLFTEGGGLYMAGNFAWGMRLSALFLYGVTLLYALRAELRCGRLTLRLGVSVLLVAAHTLGGWQLYVGYATQRLP